MKLFTKNIELLIPLLSLLIFPNSYCQAQAAKTTIFSGEGLSKFDVLVIDINTPSGDTDTTHFSFEVKKINKSTYSSQIVNLSSTGFGMFSAETIASIRYDFKLDNTGIITCSNKNEIQNLLKESLLKKKKTLLRSAITLL